MEKNCTFRAGTIGTLADRTAYGYVKNYFDEKKFIKECGSDRIIKAVLELRSTGQHPGGIVVLPHGEEINSFTPVQKPTK